MNNIHLHQSDHHRLQRSRAQKRPEPEPAIHPRSEGCRSKKSKNLFILVQKLVVKRVNFTTLTSSNSGSSSSGLFLRYADKKGFTEMSRSKGHERSARSKKVQYLGLGRGQSPMKI